MSWSSPAIPHLISNKSEFPVTINQSSWIASLSSIGMLIGYILNPLIINFLSAKNTLLLLSVPHIISWILIIFGRNYIILYIARIIGGIGCGAGLCATTIYLSGIGDKNTRGSFLVIVKLSINFGIFFAALIGAYLPYNEMNFAHLSIPLIFILTFSFMPDSSDFARSRQYDEIEKIDEEMENLSKIQKLLEPDFNPKLESELELESELNPKIQNVRSKSEETFSKLINSWRKLFTIRSNRKSLAIILTIAATEIFSGYISVLTYTQQIFAYSGYSLAPEEATLVLAALKIISSIACTQIVDKIKKRTLILMSGLSAAFFQGLVGFFFYLKFCTEFDVSFINWLPLLGITMYGIVLTIGISPLYYVFQGELFPNDVKSSGVTFVNIIYEIVSFLVKLKFYVLIDAVGIHMTFGIFAILCFFGTFIGFYIIPETKGKSLEEIQAILSSEKNRKISKDNYLVEKG